MGNLAIDLRAQSVFHEYGKVLDCGELISVTTETGVHSARRAAICLLRPAPGDTVLMSVGPGGECYVLAVLTRVADTPFGIDLGEGVAMQVNGESLEISARGGVTMKSASRVALSAPSVEMTALHSNISVEHLSFSGTLLQAQVHAIRLVADSFDSIVRRIHQSVTNSFRRIEQTDDVKAGQIDYRARDSASVHGTYTFVTAKSVVKVDAEQIHVG